MRGRGLTRFTTLISSKSIQPFRKPLGINISLKATGVIVTIASRSGQPITNVAARSAIIHSNVIISCIKTIQTIQAVGTTLRRGLNITLAGTTATVPPNVLSNGIHYVTGYIRKTSLRIVGIVSRPATTTTILNVHSNTIISINNNAANVDVLHSNGIICATSRTANKARVALILSNCCSVNQSRTRGVGLSTSRRRTIFPVICPIIRGVTSVIGHFMSNHRIGSLCIINNTYYFDRFRGIFRGVLRVPARGPGSYLFIAPLNVTIGRWARMRRGRCGR